MSPQVITGANAILSLQTPSGLTPVQLCSNVNVTENTTLSPVTGLGKLYKESLEVTGWDGSGSLTFYNGLLAESAERLALDNRIAQNIEEWTAYLLTRIKTDGAILNIYQRSKDQSQNQNAAFAKLFCTIKHIFITSQSFAIGENQISNVTYNFTFTEPIIYPK